MGLERSVTVNLPYEKPSALDAHGRFSGRGGPVTSSPIWLGVSIGVWLELHLFCIL